MTDLASQKDVIGRDQSGRYLWVLLSLVTGVTITQGIMSMGLPVLYPFIQSEFGLSRVQVGLITSFLAFGTGTTVMLAGWFTDTFGVKRMITIAMLLLSAFIIAFPLAYSFPLILGLAAVIGIVLSPINPAVTQAVIDWFPVRIRALAMSVKQMGIPVAGALTAAVLPTLATVTGWRIAAALTGLLVLAISIAFIFLYHDAPAGAHPARKFNLATFKSMLRNRGLAITIFWGATFVGFQFIALSYLMLFLIEELDMSPVVAGGLLAIAQTSSIISRVAWGGVSDFIFHGRRTVVLVLTGFLTFLWMAGASLIHTGVPGITVYLMAVVIGISTLSFHGVLLTHIAEQAEPGQVGMTVGFASTLMQVSQIVISPLFGYLVDVTNSYIPSWRIAAGAALAITLALMVFGREPKRGRKPVTR